MRFDVTVLGSNSAIPAHGRNQTSQLVHIGMSAILLDCGEGTQVQFSRFRLKSSKIDFIFISHLHGDHFYGLMGMISSFHLHGRRKLLTIFGPRGLDEIITVHLKHGNTKLNYPLRFERTNAEEKVLVVEEKNYRVYSFPLKHRIPCTGFLIEEKRGFLNLVKEKLLEKKIPVEAILKLRKGEDVKGPDGKVIYDVDSYTHTPKPLRSYAYCSDTRYDPDLVQYLKCVSLLYHEATFSDTETIRANETAHSTAKQAAMIAEKTAAKKLLLGHFSTRYSDLSPLLNEAKEVFFESYLSEEGRCYEV